MMHICSSTVLLRMEAPARALTFQCLQLILAADVKVYQLFDELALFSAWPGEQRDKIKFM